MPNSSSGNFNSSAGLGAPSVAAVGSIAGGPAQNNPNSIEEVSVGEGDKEANGEGKFCEIQ